MDKKEITRLDLAKGATIFKQGHYETLAFTPRNADGEVVDLTGKTIDVVIVNGRSIVYETAGTFDSADNTIQFAISENIGHGDMWMEITVTNPANPAYRQKFPTSEYEGKLKFIRSADDVDYVGFGGKTVSKFEEMFNTAVAAVTEDSEVVSARNGYTTLGKRLEAEKLETALELAEKANKAEVEAKLSQIGDAKPSGVFDNIAALQAAFPTGDGKNIYILSSDGNWYYWNGIGSWTAGGLYQSRGIGEKTIGPKETTFAISGKNLWDGKIVENASLSGAVPNGTYGSLAGARSIIKKVPKGSKVVVSRISGSSDRFRLAAKAGVPTPGSAMRYVLANDIGSTITTTLQGEEDHIFVYVSSFSTGFPQQFQIEIGDAKTDYESHEMVTIQLTKESFENGGMLEDKNEVLETRHYKRGSVTPEVVSFLQPGKNLWDGRFIKDFSLTGSSTADGSFSASSSQGLIVVHKITPGEEVTTSRIAGSSNRFRVATFNRYPQIGDRVNRFILTNDPGSRVPFTAIEGEEYVVAYVSINDNYKEPTEFMIERGLEKTDYESPDKVTMDFSSNQFFGKKRKDLYLTNVIAGNYTNEQAYTSVLSNDINDLYTYIDRVMDKYPGYIKKTLFGMGSGNLPIYLYDFTPPEPKLGVELTQAPFPKIIYNVGTHGFEKHAIWGAAKFFADLADNWRTDDFLNTLRWNIHFRYIPCLNPAGFNANTRKNGNGVDLNRNFTEGYGTGNTDPTSDYYQGTGPSTEPEVQLMEQFIQQEKKDTLFLIDHHNSGGWQSQGHVIWSSANDDEVRKMVNGFNHYMESKAKRDFPYIDENLVLQHLSVPLGGGVAYAAHLAGIRSSLLETAVQFNSQSDSQKFNTESVGNLLLSILKGYS